MDNSTFYVSITTLIQKDSYPGVREVVRCSTVTLFLSWVDQDDDVGYSPEHKTAVGRSVIREHIGA